MSSKRRTSTTLPRHRTPATSTPAAVQQRTISRRHLFAIGGIAVVGAAGAIAAGSLLRDGDAVAPVTASTNVPETERVKGYASAPVTVVEYADLQCPACARFSQTIEPQIAEAYIATGVVRFEYKHFAFLGKESQRAAEACECAAEQGAFFAYRDALYAAQRGENRGAFNDNTLRRIATDLELDVAAFDEALASGRHAATVKQHTSEGRTLGVQATPTFFINGRKLEGLASFDAYKRMIDQAAGGAS